MNILKKIADKTLSKKHHNIPELTEFRLNRCKACIYLKPENMECGVCGCFMEVKTKMELNINPKKLRVEITHCPKGFWGDETLAKLYEG